MKILHVVPNFNPGGGERVAAQLAIELQGLGHEVQVLALGPSDNPAIEKMLDAHRVPSFSLGKGKGFSLGAMRKLLRFIQSYRPDVVHTHQHVLPYVLPFLILPPRPRILHTVHSLADKEVAWTHRWLHRIAFRWGVVPVAIATEVANSMKAVYSRQSTEIVMNRVPIPDKVKQWGAADGPVRIVMVARLSAPKDHHTLFQAFRLLHVDHPDAELHLIGEGDLKTELEELARSLKIEEQVHFRGFIDPVADSLLDYDGFVLSSRWEGNPLSVMEAMMAGLPVICSRVGGIPELVDEGYTGFLVPPGDIQALYQRMKQFAESPELRKSMGTAARCHALRYFSARSMAESYLRLYDVSSGRRLRKDEL